MRILNISPEGRGGVERISEIISRHFGKSYELKTVHTNVPITYLWRAAACSDLVIVHRGRIFRKLLPFLILPKPFFLFMHHFFADDVKKDPYHRLIYSRVSAVVVLSRRIYRQVKENWDVDEGKLFVAYPGVDVRRFFKSERLRQETRERYGIERSEVVFGVVGRICKEKNQGLLVRSLALVRRARVLIVGPVEDRSYLRKLMDLMDRLKVKGIIIPEFVENIEEIYNAFDFLVITSRREPFGLVGLEAMACSVPVMVPDNSGISEIISNGIDSFVFRSCDERALSELITEILRGDVTDVSKRAREKVEGDFTEEGYIRRLEDILNLANIKVALY